MKSSQPSRVSVPKHCHPLAKVVFAEMNRQRVTYEELEFYSGVLRTSTKAWRSHNTPGLNTIEACLGYLGWSVLPVPKAETLPAELRADLEAVAVKHGTTSLPCLEFIAAAVGRLPETRKPYSRLAGPRPVTRDRRYQQESLAA